MTPVRALLDRSRDRREKRLPRAVEIVPCMFMYDKLRAMIERDEGSQVMTVQLQSG